jgi:hypothetical protein
LHFGLCMANSKIREHSYPCRDLGRIGGARSRRPVSASAGDGRPARGSLVVTDDQTRLTSPRHPDPPRAVPSRVRRGPRCPGRNIPLLGSGPTPGARDHLPAGAGDYRFNGWPTSWACTCGRCARRRMTDASPRLFTHDHILATSRPPPRERPVHCL